MFQGSWRRQKHTKPIYTQNIMSFFFSAQNENTIKKNQLKIRQMEFKKKNEIYSQGNDSKSTGETKPFGERAGGGLCAIPHQQYKFHGC